MKTYVAFISYRHAELDSRVAAKLHTLLERYRIPGEIAKTYGGKKLGRVFRDREELPLSSDLSGSIMEALDKSEHLIVVCSPDTPWSIWVQREIEHFLTKHSRDKVLAVLVSGEPDESFPKALTQIIIASSTDTEFPEIKQTEPLAADVRAPGIKQTYRKLREEVTRIAAAILSCPYDELRQRQRQHKKRKRTAIFAGAMAVALGFTGLTALKNLEISKKNQELDSKNALIEQKNTELSSTLEKMQINQSQFLSNQAHNVLESGDRLGAIQIALAALPSEDKPRPLVADAEYALSEALYAYQASGNELYVDKALKHEAYVQTFCIAGNGEYIVSFDERFALTCWSVAKGNIVWQLQAKEVISDWERAYLTDGSLYAFKKSNRIIAQYHADIVCVDVRTGSILWTKKFDPYLSGSQGGLSSDESLVAVFHTNSLSFLSTADGVTKWSHNIDSVEDIYFDKLTFSIDDKFSLVSFHSNATSPDLKETHYGLVLLDLQQRTAFKKEVLPPGTEALAFTFSANNDILLLSYTPAKSLEYRSYDPLEVHIQRIALESLSTLWDAQFTVNGNDGWREISLYYSVGSKEPYIGKQGVTCTVGREMRIFDFKDGSVYYTGTWSSGVVSSTPIRYGDIIAYVTEDNLTYANVFSRVGIGMLSDPQLLKSTDIAQYVEGILAIAARNSTSIIVYGKIDSKELPVVKRYSNESNVADSSFNRNQTLCAVTEYDSVDSLDKTLISVYTTDTWKLMKQHEFDGHGTFLGFSMDGLHFLYSSAGEYESSYNIFAHLSWCNTETGTTEKVQIELNDPFPTVFDRKSFLSLLVSDYVLSADQSTLYGIYDDYSRSSANRVEVDSCMISISMKAGEAKSSMIAPKPKSMYYVSDSFKVGTNNVATLRYASTNKSTEQMIFYSLRDGARWEVNRKALAVSTAMAAQKSLYASLDADNYLRVYDITREALIREIYYEAETVAWIRFCRDDTCLLIGSNTVSVNLLEIETGKMTDSLQLSLFVTGANYLSKDDEIIFIDNGEVCIIGAEYVGYIIDLETLSLKGVVPHYLNLVQSRNEFIVSNYRNGYAFAVYPYYDTQALTEWGYRESHYQPLTDTEKMKYFITQ